MQLKLILQPLTYQQVAKVDQIILKQDD